MKTVTEKNAAKMNGFFVLFVTILLIGLIVFLFVYMIENEQVILLALIIPLLLLWSIMMNGFIILQPNDSKVLLVFGKYTGTVRDSGYWFVNPFSAKKQVTLRIRNFNSEKIKVNDLHGNPIEIAAVVVWKVVDSARAVFDVDHYEEFVAIQSETAIRSLTSEYLSLIHI